MSEAQTNGDLTRKPKANSPAPYSSTQGLAFYRFWRIFLGTILRVIFRIQIHGRENIPTDKPFVFASSHRSLFDVPFMGIPPKRRLRFIGKRELFEIPVVRTILRALGGVPIERGAADRGALKVAQLCLSAGEPVVVFPEGTRQNGREIQPLHDGAAYIAYRAGVPIVPVGIAGSEEILSKGRKLPRLHRVVIVVGPPIDISLITTGSRREDVAAITAKLHVELQSVFDAACERAY